MASAQTILIIDMAMRYYFIPMLYHLKKSIATKGELLLTLIFLGIYLVLVLEKLTIFPVYFFCDEAIIGVEAQSIATTGVDSFGEAWPVFYTSVVVAEAELALKLADYERAMDVTDTLLARLAEFGMRAFTPYARYLQGQALLGLNRKNAARERWLESRDEAEAIDSRRTLWRVLNALSQLEGDPTEAERLRQEAQHVIEYIAEHIDCADLRESFLNLPDVQAVLEPASDD